MQQIFVSCIFPEFISSNTFLVELEFSIYNMSSAKSGSFTSFWLECLYFFFLPSNLYYIFLILKFYL